MTPWSMLSPDKVSIYLRRIATKIESSEQPSQALVQRDLRLLASAIMRQQRVERVAREMLQIAADDVEVGLWDTEEGTTLKNQMKYTYEQQEVDKLKPALRALKRDVDDFMGEITREPGPKKPGVPDKDVVTSAPPR